MFVLNIGFETNIRIYYGNKQTSYLLSNLHSTGNGTQRRFTTAPEPESGSGGINIASGIYLFKKLKI
jgi:hypothetical protein